MLQTAVAIVLTPLFEAEFEDCSFAYRRGRSVDLAVRRIMQYRDQGFRWVVDADIASFFAEIDQERLVREVAELVQDVRIIDLIKLWLRAPITDGETIWRPTKGIALGSPISPLLANLYLDHLDEALLGEDLRLVRFADDFLILCKHEEQAGARGVAGPSTSGVGRRCGQPPLLCALSLVPRAGPVAGTGDGCGRLELHCRLNADVRDRVL